MSERTRRITLQGYRNLRRSYLTLCRDYRSWGQDDQVKDVQRSMAFMRRTDLPYLL